MSLLLLDSQTETPATTGGFRSVAGRWMGGIASPATGVVAAATLLVVQWSVPSAAYVAGGFQAAWARGSNVILGM